MALPVVELLIIALGEFIGVIIFYNTGAILIRIFTFGKTTFPIFGPSFMKEKTKLKYGYVCYLSGFAFYMLIISALTMALINIKG